MIVEEGVMESTRAKLERQIFDYLDAALPNELKRKLSSIDNKFLVQAIADLASSGVLRDHTRSDHDQSKFEPSTESPEFLADLSKL